MTLLGIYILIRPECHRATTSHGHAIAREGGRGGGGNTQRVRIQGSPPSVPLVARRLRWAIRKVRSASSNKACEDPKFSSKPLFSSGKGQGRKERCQAAWQLVDRGSSHTQQHGWGPHPEWSSDWPQPSRGGLALPGGWPPARRLPPARGPPPAPPLRWQRLPDLVPALRQHRGEPHRQPTAPASPIRHEVRGRGSWLARVQQRRGRGQSGISVAPTHRGACLVESIPPAGVDRSPSPFELSRTTLPDPCPRLLAMLPMGRGWKHGDG